MIMGKLVGPAQCQADILHGSYEALRFDWLTARGFHDGSEDNVFHLRSRIYDCN